MAQYQHTDKEFGAIIVTIRKGMRNITARWKAGVLHLNSGEYNSYSDIVNAIDELRPKIRKIKPASTANYHNGDIIECFKITISIATHNLAADRIHIFPKKDAPETHLVVSIPEKRSFTSPETTTNISKIIERIAAHHATKIIPIHALTISNTLGLYPKEYVIGRGKRKLGHCTPGKVIQLSHNLMFMPQILIDYIICHELAHITHMNHSDRFHALCNEYCIKITHRSEPELRLMLKRFKSPIL